MKPLIQTNIPEFMIRSAVADDVGLILGFVRELAEYEKLLDEVMAKEQGLRETLFGEHRFADVLIGACQNRPVAVARFFSNYSTCLNSYVQCRDEKSCVSTKPIKQPRSP